jgi:hypothetical protein
MKLPNSAHTDQPWRIHEITPDFRLYDVWALPTPGGSDDFLRLVQQLARGDTGDNPSWFAAPCLQSAGGSGRCSAGDTPD